MRLPPPTADSSARYAGTVPGREAGRGRPPGIGPAASIGCLTGCVGQTAYDCLRCGSDLACWSSCAGPESVGCVSACYGSGA
jgi:hypothetical protein